MTKSLKNILLSEDTGEDLKKKGYIKIADNKVTEYEQKGCKVVKSDSGTHYAKCEKLIKYLSVKRVKTRGFGDATISFSPT